MSIDNLGLVLKATVLFQDFRTQCATTHALEREATIVAAASRTVLDSTSPPKDHTFPRANPEHQLLRDVVSSALDHALGEAAAARSDRDAARTRFLEFSELHGVAPAIG
jgi:hypothetical protein